jgi:hypothetical protein
VSPARSLPTNSTHHHLFAHPHGHGQEKKAPPTGQGLLSALLGNHVQLGHALSVRGRRLYAVKPAWQGPYSVAACGAPSRRFPPCNGHPHRPHHRRPHIRGPQARSGARPARREGKRKSPDRAKQPGPVVGWLTHGRQLTPQPGSIFSALLQQFHRVAFRRLDRGCWWATATAQCFPEIQQSLI